MGILVNLINSLLGYNDARGVVNNPLQRSFDWERRYQSIPMKSGSSDSAVIEPGGSITLFDGTRTLPTSLVASSSVLSISKLDSTKSIYRLTIVSGPGAFRQARTTSFASATSLTFAVNNNAVATLSVPNSVNGDFTNAQVGDIVRIKGVNTQDSSNLVFAAPNSGYWIIIAKAGNNLSVTLRRPYNQSFSGLNETVTLGATDTANQVLIYSPLGIQINDSFIIQGTFSSATWNDYDVLQVGPSFIDFVVGSPIPEESNLTLASTNDLIVYANAKKLVYIEADQSVAVRYNLDSSDNNMIKPIQVGNDVLNGFDKKLGFAWKCILVNKSTINPANVKWIACE